MPELDVMTDKSETMPQSIAHEEPIFPEASFLDLTVHAITMEDMHRAIAFSIEHQQKWLIANHNLHSVYLAHKQLQQGKTGLANYYRAARWTHVDGMSIVALASLFGHTIRRSHRIAYNYSLPHLLTLAEQKGWRVFYLGSSEAVSQDGLHYLRSRFPSLSVETQHGFFSKEKNSDANQAVLARIAEFKPNILFVGMGMPIQEEWIAENYDALSANIILASGATLDYFVGALPIPPRWVGRMGLEWAYRLANEPLRLGSRYLLEPWSVLLMVLKHALRKLTFSHR